MYHPQQGAKFVAWERHERKKSKPLVSRDFYNKFLANEPEENFEFIPTVERREFKCLIR